MKKILYYKKTGMYIDWDQIKQLPDIQNFIDIGIGKGTFVFWKKFKNKRIICIDPLSYSEKIVHKHLKGTNYSFHKFGAGSKEEYRYLKVENNIGRSTFLNVTKKNFEGKPLYKLKTHIKTVDSIVRKLKIRGSNGIKIDTEGFELEVLMGSINTLKKTKFVVLETRHNHISFKRQYKLSDLMKFMTKHKFVLTNIYTAKPFIADLCFQKINK